MKIKSNIVNNLGKVSYLSISDLHGVPMPLKDGFHHAHQNFPEGGTCLEFGVCWGSTYLWQALQILNRYPKSKLIGFDSWQGLPAETPGVWAPDRHAPGCFTTGRQGVVDRVAELGATVTSNVNDRFSLVDGFFKDSLTNALQVEIRDRDLVFVNIDVDIHSSTVEVLEWLEPLLRPGVVIYFDDWKDPQDGEHEGGWGEHRAWDEWTVQHPRMDAKLLALNDFNQRAYEIIQWDWEYEDWK